MISVIELKKYETNISIFGIVIGKLRYEKEPYPIILLKVDKDSEVSFYYTILLFGLPVRLRLKIVKWSTYDRKH